jgi:hypothetical protein
MIHGFYPVHLAAEKWIFQEHSAEQRQLPKELDPPTTGGNPPGHNNDPPGRPKFPLLK